MSWATNPLSLAAESHALVGPAARFRLMGPGRGCFPPCTGGIAQMPTTAASDASSTASHSQDCRISNEEVGQHDRRLGPASNTTIDTEWYRYVQCVWSIWYIYIYFLFWLAEFWSKPEYPLYSFINPQAFSTPGVGAVLCTVSPGSCDTWMASRSEWVNDGMSGWVNEWMN